MSARVIKRRIAVEDDGLSDMFNQMLGTGAINLNIAYPRYLRMKELSEKLIRLIDVIGKSPYIAYHEDMAPVRDDFARWLPIARADHDRLFRCDLTDFQWDLSAVDEGLKSQFAELYTEAKKSTLINTFITILDNLIPHKRHIADVNSITPNFILLMPGVDFCPLSFTRLNFKRIVETQPGEGTVRFFLMVLNKFYEFTMSMYNEVTSPDIDVDQFVRMIESSMDQLQSRPELHRCRKAFAKIKESVHMLKNNFNNYYRDYLSTKDSTIIMQHFVLDVSKETSADPETIRQFRQIISYYRKLAQQQKHNPKLNAIFERANECFKQLDSRTPNMQKEKTSEPTESSDESTNSAGSA